VSDGSIAARLDFRRSPTRRDLVEPTGSALVVGVPAARRVTNHGAFVVLETAARRTNDDTPVLVVRTPAPQPRGRVVRAFTPFRTLAHVVAT
jgi:hypothetical protein